MPRTRALPRPALRLTVMAASVALLAGCATPPAESDGAADTDFCATMVTNSGGLEDRSFN